MRIANILTTLPLALCQELVIPQVERAVAQERELFAKYTDYVAGPTGAAKAAASKATPKVLAKVVQQNARIAAVAAAGTPYWYEQITHQGRSAFNNDATYKVYRNVKDYGAKG